MVLCDLKLLWSNDIGNGGIRIAIATVNMETRYVSCYKPLVNVAPPQLQVVMVGLRLYTFSGLVLASAVQYGNILAKQ